MDSFKNSYKVEDKRLVSLAVYNVGYQHCEPGHQWGPGVRDHYLIHYVVSGKGYYTVGGIEHELSAGDLFVVYPGTGVCYRADEKEPWEYYWVGFSGSDAPSMIEATAASHTDPVIRGIGKSTDNSLAKHILRIYEARGNDYAAAVRMTGELYLTLCELIEAAANSPGAQPYDYSYVQKALDHISMNYSYPLTVDSIADFVGVSRSQLFREFKKYLNTSPKEYLTSLRMRKACALLKGTSLSVTEVACSVGYDDSMYFSRVFKKEIGVPPSKYGPGREEAETTQA